MSINLTKKEKKFIKKYPNIAYLINQVPAHRDTRIINGCVLSTGGVGSHNPTFTGLTTVENLKLQGDMVCEDSASIDLTGALVDLSNVTTLQLPRVEITAPSTATSGTLTEDELTTLQSSEAAYILFDGEIYRLNDNEHVSGSLGYSHTGYENDKFYFKNITVTISTRSWVKNEMGYKEFTYNGLKFTSIGSSSIGYTITGSLPDIHIQYHLKDGDWVDWDGSNIILDDGEAIWVRNTANTLSTSGSNYFKFTMTGSIKASGDVSSMINFAGLSNYCYSVMFYGCTSLTTAPTLPATTLANSCYESMFKGCTSLTTAPALPATTLAEGCYYRMFNDCTSLKVNENGSSGTTIFTCPSTIPTYAVTDMFYNISTSSSFSGTPIAGNTYKWYN